MSEHCKACGSDRTIKKGKDFRGGQVSQRYRCTTCNANFYTEDVAQTTKVTPVQPNTNRTWVVTSAVNGVEVNKNFLETLKLYCAINGAELLIVPVKYSQGLDDGWDECLHKYFIRENTELTTGLRLLAGLHISPAIGNPLSGFESFSKGSSIILAHPQMMMKTIAMSHVDWACMITTTGSVTNSTYTQTKQGEKANFNHSFSALVIEEDAEIDSFHIRVLNSDESGSFYDVDSYYRGNMVIPNTHIPALVVGDEHVIFTDPDIAAATFTEPDSMVSALRPSKIIRHDVLDFYSANHHHSKNIFTQYAKHMSGKNDVAKELALTIDHIVNTTPKDSESIIISSNHNEHLLRWLNEANPKIDPTNALIYHELLYLMLKDTKMGISGAEYPNPLALWTKNNYDTGNIRFIGGSESFKIHGIECAFHGDKGTNGSRGSVDQFSKLGLKTIIGHSHSPNIFGGCYQVGCTAYIKLEYNSGPSSWAHAHCIIQPNGKRQMLFIKKHGAVTKWRR
jgi:hypothetical protein